jgi:hypothetical protein
MAAAAVMSEAKRNKTAVPTHRQLAALIKTRLTRLEQGHFQSTRLIFSLRIKLQCIHGNMMRVPLQPHQRVRELVPSLINALTNY